MIKRLATAALVLLGWAHAAGAAEPFKIDDEDGHGALRTSNGLLVVWNSSAAHFTLELEGKDMRVLELEGLGFSMDGRVVQVIVVDPAMFAPKGAAADEILRLHIPFEADYFSKLAGAPLPTATRTPRAPLPPGMLLWEIRNPPATRVGIERPMVKTLFLTAVIGDRLLVVSHPVPEDADETAEYDYLEHVARSIRAQSTRVDIRAVQESLRSGKASNGATAP